MFLNVDPISARFPLFVGVEGVPVDVFAKVRAACTSEDPSLTSGCRANDANGLLQSHMLWGAVGALKQSYDHL